MKLNAETVAKIKSDAKARDSKTQEAEMQEQQEVVTEVEVPTLGESDEVVEVPKQKRTSFKDKIKHIHTMVNNTIQNNHKRTLFTCVVIVFIICYLMMLSKYQRTGNTDYLLISGGSIVIIGAWYVLLFHKKPNDKKEKGDTYD